MTEVEPLCCCEYYDETGERNHILSCCCNCVQLDNCMDSLLRCQTVSDNMIEGVIDQIRNRMRIPWRGGAKQIHFGAAAAIFVLPILHLFAALNNYTFVTAALVTIYGIYRMMLRAQQLKRRTKFFLCWTWTCIVVIWCIFEMLVVPLLEILMEEHHLYNIFFFTGIFCLHRTTSLSSTLQSNKVNERNESVDVDSEAAIDENGDSSDNSGNRPLLSSGACTESVCGHCRLEFETTFCNVCKISVRKHHYFSYWLDCCIDQNNQKFFFVFLVCSIAALVYGGNLILTTVCEPFRFYKTVLMPYDCSDVFEEYDLSLSYICGVHTTMLSLILLVYAINYVSYACHSLSLGHISAILGYNKRSQLLSFNA